MDTTRLERNAGFTIVELCIVMAIASVLLTIGSLNFKKMQRNEAVRNQLHEMRTFVVEAQLKSMLQKKRGVVDVNGKKITVWHYDENGGYVVSSKTLRYPVIGGRYYVDTTGYQYGTFAQDERLYACMDAPGADAANVLVIEHVLVRTGKKSVGGNCTPADVTLQ